MSKNITAKYIINEKEYFLTLDLNQIKNPVVKVKSEMVKQLYSVARRLNSPFNEKDIKWEYE